MSGPNELALQLETIGLINKEAAAANAFWSDVNKLLGEMLFCSMVDVVNNEMSRNIIE